MIPCSCAGINITWACNTYCVHCFYKRFDELHQNIHFKFDDVLAEAKAAKDRGCDRVVFIGRGEPMLYPQIAPLVAAVTALGMATNIISNGAFPVLQYQRVIDAGLKQLQLSVHAVDATLDKIMDYSGAYEKQSRLIDWLKERDFPFRTNTTLQQLNYKKLTEIAKRCVEAGAFHISLLGFLPLYQWRYHAHEVAVHPAELRVHLERAARYLLEKGRLFTIRYHPFCHLDPELWPYVTNVRYILFDPWEWDYGSHGKNVREVWSDAVKKGDSFALRGEPCSSCVMKEHCGGWSATSAGTFAGAKLKALQMADVPEKWRALVETPGAFFDMNPANRRDGLGMRPSETSATAS